MFGIRKSCLHSLTAAALTLRKTEANDRRRYDLYAGRKRGRIGEHFDCQRDDAACSGRGIKRISTPSQRSGTEQHGSCNHHGQNENQGWPSEFNGNGRCCCRCRRSVWIVDVLVNGCQGRKCAGTSARPVSIHEHLLCHGYAGRGRGCGKTQRDVALSARLNRDNGDCHGDSRCGNCGADAPIDAKSANNFDDSN